MARPDASSIATVGGSSGADPYRASANRTGTQEVYSAAVEIVWIERSLFEARNDREYFRGLRHLTIKVLSYALAIHAPTSRREEWKVDEKRLVNLRHAVVNFRIQSDPVIRYSVQAHSDPVIYELWIATFPMTTCAREDVQRIAEDLRKTYVAREVERATMLMEAACGEGFDILAKYGKWDLDTKFRTTAEGYDASRFRADVQDERVIISDEHLSNDDSEPNDDSGP